MLILKILLIAAIVLIALFILLFSIYFFNLDMKLMTYVVYPLLEKHYNKIKRKQYL